MMFHAALKGSNQTHRNLVIAFLLAGLGWLVLFWPHFETLLSRWNTEDYSYCYLIPLVAGYLVWLVRDQVMDSVGGAPILGYVGLGLSGLFFLFGRLGSLETFVYFSMWLSIVSVVVVVLGARCLKVLSFPLFLLVFIVPAPPFLTKLLSFNLRLISSGLAVKALHLLSIPALQEGNLIDLGNTQLQVVDACSGLRYLLPTVIMALIIGFLYHRKLWAKAVLVLLSIPVSVVINALRVVVMAVLARYISPSLAEEGLFHDITGWFIFLLSLAVVFGVSLALRILERPAASVTKGRENEIGSGSVEETQDSPKTDGKQPVRPRWAVIHGMTVGLCLLALSLSQVFLVHTQVIPPRESFQDFPMVLEAWEGKREYLSQDILDSLWADDYVNGIFSNPLERSSLSFLVSYYKTQTTFHTAHAPTACLVGGGWELKTKLEIAADQSTGRTFAVQQMVLENGKQRVLSNFWFQQRGRIITNEYLNKVYLIWDSLVKRRTDGALVRIEMLLRPGQSVEEGQKILDGFIGQLAKRLPAYVPS